MNNEEYSKLVMRWEKLKSEYGEWLLKYPDSSDFESLKGVMEEIERIVDIELNQEIK